MYSVRQRQHRARPGPVHSEYADAPLPRGFVGQTACVSPALWLFCLSLLCNCVAHCLHHLQLRLDQAQAPSRAAGPQPAVPPRAAPRIAPDGLANASNSRMIQCYNPFWQVDLSYGDQPPVGSETCATKSDGKWQQHKTSDFCKTASEGRKKARLDGIKADLKAGKNPNQGLKAHSGTPRNWRFRPHSLGVVGKALQCSCKARENDQSSGEHRG